MTDLYKSQKKTMLFKHLRNFESYEKQKLDEIDELQKIVDEKNQPFRRRNRIRFYYPAGA